MKLSEAIGKFAGAAATYAQPFALEDQKAKIDEARDQRLNQYATERDTRLINADNAREAQRQQFEGEQNRLNREQRATEHADAMEVQRKELDVHLAQLGIERNSAKLVDALNQVKLDDEKTAQQVLAKLNDPKTPPDVADASVRYLNARAGKMNDDFVIQQKKDDMGNFLDEYVIFNKSTGKFVEQKGTSEPTGGVVPPAPAKDEGPGLLSRAFSAIWDAAKNAGSAISDAATSSPPNQPRGQTYSGLQKGAGSNPNLVSDALSSALTPAPRGPQSGLSRVASAPTGQASMPTRPMTADEYAAAPSGTRYMAPDGSIRVKR